MNKLTQEELKSLLTYDDLTGSFLWNVSTKRLKVGSVAGTTNGSGYRQICINKKIYPAHRLAWLYVHGYIPSMDLDHIDGDRANNAIANLRHVSRSTNLQNQRKVRLGKKSIGKLGTSLVKTTGRWHARIMVNKKQMSLGCFASMEEAHQKYLSAKRTFHQGCTI